MYTVYKPQTSL